MTDQTKTVKANMSELRTYTITMEVPVDATEEEIRDELLNAGPDYDWGSEEFDTNIEAIDGMTEVTLTYFKESGKYYTEGKIEVPSTTPVYEVSDIVNYLSKKKELPGLSTGNWEHVIHVDCSKLDVGYPFIINPFKR